MAGEFNDLIPQGGGTFNDMVPKRKPRPAAMAVPQSTFPPGTAPAKTDTPELSWGDVATGTVRNLPASAGNFLHDLVQPFIHPIDTANALGGIAAGVINKTGRPGNLRREWDAEPTPQELQRRAEIETPADAVGQYYALRYGSLPGFKNALATDPVGVAGDASAVLSAGGALPTRAGPLASRVGAVLDPVTLGGNALRLASKGIKTGVGTAASAALGMTTGAGGPAVRRAWEAGAEGGAKGQAFVENMRGDVPQIDVVDRARAALGEIRKERSDAYKTDMAKLGQDMTVLDFADIDAAVAKAAEVGTFRGASGTAVGVSTEPKAAAIVAEMTDEVNNWKKLDPADFHTAIGIDALKRSLANIRDSTGYGTPERVAADRIYQGVRQVIVDQAPQYAATMEAYEKASRQIGDTTKAFSLGEKVAGETSARKLQSITRNNVQTGYGERVRLMDELAKKDPGLPYAISGQALNTWDPRGIVARGGLVGGGIASGFALNPWMIPVAPAFSPRVVGEAAYAGGRASDALDSAVNALNRAGVNAANVRGTGQVAYQTGKAEDLVERARELRRRNALANPPQRP